MEIHKDVRLYKFRIAETKIRKKIVWKRLINIPRAERMAADQNVSPISAGK